MHRGLCVALGAMSVPVGMILGARLFRRSIF